MRELNVNETEVVNGGDAFAPPQVKVIVRLPGGEYVEMFISPLMLNV